jgi:putative MATE family efflux protein
MINDLTTGPILKHIRNIAVPASIGMIFNTLYNVVDTFYAGNISTDALAGMTISFPIFFIIIALSTGIGSGATALCSIALGKKDSKEFHQLGYNAFFTGFIVSLVILFSAPFLTEFLFKLSGASGNAMQLGINYTNTIFYGSIFFIMNSIINGLLNAQGDTKSYRNFLIIGFFLNLILDPLFIFGWFGLPMLGTVGVALATVIVQAIGTVYLTYRLLNSTIFELTTFKQSLLSYKTIGNLLKQGMPASLNMATIAIGVFVINYFVLAYAEGSATIAAYGAAMRLEQMALLPALGLNIAALTITGQNFGAKKYERIYEVQRNTNILAVGIMIIGGIIIYPFAPQLIGLFNNDPEVIRAGTVYLRIEVIAFPTYVILNILISVLQGIKKPNFAVYIGLYRQILIPFLLFPFLAQFLGLGISGVWWGIVLINWSAVLITFIYNKNTLRKVLV